MRKLSILLSVLLLVCALGLVTSQHRARKLFYELERANAHTVSLQNRWEELRGRQTNLAKASLIDVKARKQLQLRIREPQRTMHLLLDGETQSAAKEATLRWRAAMLERGMR